MRDEVGAAAVVCDDCGMPLQPAHRSASTGRSRRCGACAEVRERRHVTAFLLIDVACLLLGLGGLLLDGGSGLTWGLLGFGMFFLVLRLQIVPHEAGHALAARLLGFTVHRVTLGEGSVLARVRLGSTPVELRALPSGGLTVATTGSARAFRIRQWSVVAAGPAVTALIGWAALRWQPEPAMLAPLIRHAVVGSSALLLVMNLVPWRSNRQEGPIASDGWSLLTVPALSRDAIAQAVADHERFGMYEQSRHDADAAIRSARARLDRPGVDPVLARLDLLNLLVGAERWAELLEVGRWLVDHLEPDHVSRPGVLNCVAWSALCLDDPDLLDEADRTSAEALRLEPDEPAVLGTRGGVLVVMGAAAEGLDLLRRSDVPHLAGRERAVTAALMAMGEAQRRNLFDARRHLAAAVRADRTCELLPRARRGVEALAASFEAPA